MIAVSTVYPGVSPGDIETLVTRPIEDELNNSIDPLMASLLGNMRLAEKYKAQVIDLGRIRSDHEWTQEEIAELKEAGVIP